MRDQDERTLVLLEEAREPRDRRHVEVVGGLVEQQDIGALEQQAREHAAHLPAARQLADIAFLVAAREAQTGEDREGLVLAEVALEVIDALVELGDVGGEIEQELVGGLGVDAGGFELGLGIREPAVELGAPGHARQDHVDQRAPTRDGDLLRQPPDPDPVRAGHVTVVDLLVTRDDLEQGGLARPVGTDQPDAIAMAEAQRRRVEDHSIREEQRDFVEYNQRHFGCAWIARPLIGCARDVPR